LTLGPAVHQPATATARFLLTAPGNAARGLVPIPFEVRWDDAPELASQCRVGWDVLPALAPQSPNQEAPPAPALAPRVRREARLLLYARAGEPVRLRIRNARVTTYTDALWWTLRDPDLNVLREGQIPVDQSARVEVEAPADGVYFLDVAAANSSARVESDNRYLAIEMSAEKPIHVFQESPPLFFYVPPDARRLALNVRCGGETEPVSLVLYDPAGREVLRESGTFLPRRFAVDVPARARGGSWRLEVAPREDVSVWLEGDVVPCAADHPARLLK
ncbi:MAG: hypothetical protein QHJ73_08055, partial [Armatimonadota bacterium]|nr:hypothetical protein [Armatimonadota bacterium]